MDLLDRVTLLEPFQAHQGWAWRREEDDLVLELPGWVQPAPVMVAVHLGLFDMAEDLWL